MSVGLEPVILASYSGCIFLKFGFSFLMILLLFFMFHRVGQSGDGQTALNKRFGY